MNINKKTRLFLDDTRAPTSSNFCIVRSYDDAVHFMRTRGCPDMISFDHDLQTLFTGYDLVKWMIERDMNDNGKFIPEEFEYKVHSMNPVGSANIKALLDNYLQFRLNN